MWNSFSVKSTGIVSHSPAMDSNGCTHLFHGFCNFALFYRYATDPNSRGGCWFIHLAHLCVAIFGNLSERTHSATTISHGRGRNARRGANSLAESAAPAPTAPPIPKRRIVKKAPIPEKMLACLIVFEFSAEKVLCQ